MHAYNVDVINDCKHPSGQIRLALVKAMIQLVWSSTCLTDGLNDVVVRASAMDLWYSS